MKTNYVFSVALLACVATSVRAQPATLARVDTVHPQLLRGAKPAKVGSATALKANTAAAKSSGGASAKPARVVPVPTITTQSVPPKVTRAVVATDSGGKAAPPVARSAKVAKVRPPGV